MQKEFGKLTSDQFRAVIGKIPEVLDMLQEMNGLLASSPPAKFDSVMLGGCGSYGYVYELSFIEHLTLVLVALNRQDEVHEMAAAPDPQQALLDSLARDDDADRPHNPLFERQSVVTLTYSLGRSIQSMVTYGRSISSLLQEVREKGDQEALLKAIRVDRVVLGCPTAMDVIARAQMRDNKAFFKRVRSALAGPSKKEWVGLDQMRYAFLILREMGVNELSEAALEELMVDKLQVYKPGKGDARRNLRAHYRVSRNMKTI